MKNFGLCWKKRIVALFLAGLVGFGSQASAQSPYPDGWYPAASREGSAKGGTRVSDIITTGASGGMQAPPANTVRAPGGVAQAYYQPPAATPPRAVETSGVTQATYHIPARTIPSENTAPRNISAVETSVRPQVGAEVSLKPNSVSGTDGLLAFTEVISTPQGKFQQLTVIDPKNRSICVYHVDMGTGQIELRSARDIQWDLQMNHLNAKKPLPHEVRDILRGAKN